MPPKRRPRAWSMRAHQTPNAHLPGTALRADASFDSILRDPDFGVTACAAAAGVDLCAGPCAHVRGSAVLGGVDTEPGWLQKKYANTHYQIFLRVANMTGMPVDLVHDYWETNTYLTAERLIDRMRDKKFILLTNTPRKGQGPISENYASFLKNTDIKIEALLEYTDKDLQDLEFNWLSQQTGFTVKEIEKMLRNNEQGNDAGMSNLAKLRTKKQQILTQEGLTSTHACTLASSDISIEDIMQQSQHTGGVQCICPYPPSPWGVVAPASAEPGVFACVPGHSWHRCPATALGTANVAKDSLQNDETLRGTNKYGTTFKRDYNTSLKYYLDRLNINTKREFLAVEKWDDQSIKIPNTYIPNTIMLEFERMSQNFREPFSAYPHADRHTCHTVRLNVDSETRKIQLQQLSEEVWHTILSNLRTTEINVITHRILFIGQCQNSEQLYHVQLFVNRKTLDLVRRNLKNIVEIREIEPSNISASAHTTPSNTLPGDAATQGSVELGDIFTFRPDTIIPSLRNTPQAFEVTVTAIHKFDYQDEFDANKFKTQLDYTLRSIQLSYILTVDSEDIQNMMASRHNVYGFLSKCKRKDGEMLSKRVQSVEVGDLFVLYGVPQTKAYAEDPQGIRLQVTKIEYKYPEDYDLGLHFLGNMFNYTLKNTDLGFEYKYDTEHLTMMMNNSEREWPGRLWKVPGRMQKLLEKQKEFNVRSSEP